MIDQIMTLPNMSVLIPATCESVTLQDRKDITVTIKLRILRWEDFPGLSE